MLTQLLKKGSLLAILIMLFSITFTTIAESQSVEITFWDFINPEDDTPRGKRLKKQLEIFQERYPDIKVKVQVQSPSLIDSALISAAKAKSTPDIVRVYNYFLPMHVAAGSISPLDKFTGNMDKKDWLVPWEATVFNGKKMAFPQEHRVFVFYYRKDLFNKINGKVPKTWDEVGRLGGKIKKDLGVIGYSFGLSQKNLAYVLLEWFDAMMAQGGGDIFDDKGYGVFNNPAGLKFFTLIKDMVYKYNAAPKAVANFKYDDVQNGLQTGTAASGCLATHRYAVIKASAGEENFGWAPIPSYDGSPAPLIVNGWHLVMGAYPKHPEAAFKFIEFLVSTDMQLLMVQTSSEVPVRISTYSDSWFNTKEASVMKEWSKMISEQSIPAGHWTPEWFDLGQILAKETQSMILADKSPKDALSDAQKEFNTLVKERRGY